MFAPQLILVVFLTKRHIFYLTYLLVKATLRIIPSYMLLEYKSNITELWVIKVKCLKSYQMWLNLMFNYLSSKPNSIISMETSW